MAKQFVPFKDVERELVPDLSRGQLTSALIGAVRCIQTLNALLATEHRHGDGFTPEMSEGVHELIQQQTHIIGAVGNELSRWEEEHRAEAAAEAAERGAVTDSIRKVREAFIVATAEAGAEPQVIAQALNIRRSSVERVIGQLSGGAPAAPEAAHALSA